MRKENQFSEFESYLEDRKRMTSASLSAIERARTEAALNRCRILAQRIKRRRLGRKTTGPTRHRDRDVLSH